MTKIEKFIIKAKIVHGNKYCYSKVNYIHSQSKVIIGCSIHGDFMQRPSEHLRGKGCPKCGGKKRGDLQKLTTINFIKKAKLTHGNRYDYSKVEYVNSKKKVIIICNEHGMFMQQTTSHLRGSGCPKCVGLGKINMKEFIDRANYIHNNKYDYSNVILLNMIDKIIISCPIHEKFNQAPNIHIRGSGCPKCVGLGFSYLSYDELIKIIHPLNIKSHSQYYCWWNKNKKYCQENGIPKYPDQYYNK